MDTTKFVTITIRRETLKRLESYTESVGSPDKVINFALDNIWGGGKEDEKKDI